MGPLRFRPSTSPRAAKAPKPRLTRSEALLAASRKEKAHDRYVVRTYGLRPGEYAEILARQNGRCAICGKRPRKRYLAVDHDHTTQKVRGLLCYFCNSAIGVFEFDEATARRASQYLADVAAEHALYPAPVEAHVPRVPGDDLPF